MDIEWIGQTFVTRIVICLQDDVGGRLQRGHRSRPNPVGETVGKQGRGDNGIADPHIVGINDKGIAIIITPLNNNLERINPVGGRCIDKLERGRGRAAPAEARSSPNDIGRACLQVNVRAVTGLVVGD